MSQALGKTKNPAKPTWLESWHVSPSSNPDYYLVDGLRGIAILLVVACHFFYVNPSAGPVPHFIEGFFKAGAYGVPLFFCISGFLISLPFWFRKVRGADSVAPRGYGWRRFWKIYPPLVLTVVVLTPLYILQTGDWTFLYTALQWISGLSFFVPPDGGLNPVMWSLVVEVQFYITVPLAFFCLKRVSVRRSLWVITLAFLIIPNLFRIYAYGGKGPVYTPKISSHFPAGLDFFSLGILVAGLASTNGLRKHWARAGNVGFIMLFFALLAGGWSVLHPLSKVEGTFLRYNVILASGMLLCYVANPDYPASRWLCFEPLRWIGLISYELYLVHQPMILWLRGFAGPCEGNVLKYLILQSGAFAASVFVAALIYKRFSLPILRSKRQTHTSNSAPVAVKT